MNSHLEVQDPAAARVRPRLVWSGVGLILAGIAGTGVGLMIFRSSAGTGRWVIAVGVLATLVGLSVAWWGGILQDTMGSSSDHGHEIVSGGSHAGISSQAAVVGASAQQRTAVLARISQSLLARSQASPMPTLRRPGAVILIGVGAWLCLDQWLMGYPFSVSGQNAVLRDVGLGVLLVLSGLRLRSSVSRTVSVVNLLAGALLVVSAFFFVSGSPVVRGNELVSGVLTLAAAAMTLF